MGAFVGRISLNSIDTWQITLYIKNNNTGKDIVIRPMIIKSRCYHLVNLNPGTYSLYKFSISRTSGNYRYWAKDLELKDNIIDIIVQPNKITPVSFLEIFIGYGGINRIQYGFRIDNIDNNKYLDELRLYFEELDKRGLWKDFEWDELKYNRNI